MKKMLKLMVVMMMVIAAVLTAGCGEEEKYNKLKNEVLQYAKETYAINMEWQRPVNMRYNDPVHKQRTDEKIAKVKARVPEYDKKMAELEKIAKKDSKLNNDFQQFKPETDRLVHGLLKSLIKDRKEMDEDITKSVHKNWNGKF